MNVLENILVIGLFAVFALVCISIFWWIVVSPIIDYLMGRDNNKIQWRATKATESIFCDTYVLSYRILPSSLNWFLKSFGDNEWINVHFFDDIKFNNKSEFVSLVDKFKTKKDVNDYIKEQKGIWIHP